MEDLFVEKWQPLSGPKLALVEALMAKANELNRMIPDPGNQKQARALAIARTKLEECALWAIKGICT